MPRLIAPTAVPVELLEACRNHREESMPAKGSG